MVVQTGIFSVIFLEARESNFLICRQTDILGTIAIAARDAIWRSAQEGRPYAMQELLGDRYRPA